MEFSVNISSKYTMKEIEGTGFFSGIDKLWKLNLEYIIVKTIDASLIDKCAINIECKV
ncbi:hypothetical protein [Mycoplasma zalophidermidis]|uniref:hypothetical protein n=1 Tax=Mycoplasma zalophidermidis TaxID=398174 RepID=UPI001C0F8A5E|nr:hypothetical protein [Mycoplasma zalophidermidis]MBU4690072.1 hypothetical protein [Mycoplasma zalophidermidis]MCR8966892.1 hypothetical protein [Mycoplasma zalophidermidis]